MYKEKKVNNNNTDLLSEGNLHRTAQFRCDMARNHAIPAGADYTGFPRHEVISARADRPVGTVLVDTERSYASSVGLSYPNISQVYQIPLYPILLLAISSKSVFPHVN